MTAIPESVRARMTGRLPLDRVVTFEVPRHPPELVAQLTALSDMTSSVADVMDEWGIGATFGTDAFAPLAPGMRMCGPAVTIRYVPLNGNPQENRTSAKPSAIGDRDLYGLATSGDVAVFDCSGMRTHAVLGGLSAGWAKKANLAGALVDGATRDTATVLSSGLPLWSHSRAPMAARHRVDAIELNGVVVVKGATVRPGDYVAADADGVCLIPHDIFPRVVEACVAAEHAEQSLMTLIRDSDSLEDLISRTSGTRQPD